MIREILILTPLTQAVRRLRRSPGHTLLEVLILGLALGFATALILLARRAARVDPAITLRTE